MIKILSLVCFVLMTSISWAVERPVDNGGVIYDYAATIRLYNAINKQKVLEGDCYSACTMYLAVKNKCVMPFTRLWFHSAWRSDTKSMSAEGNKTLMTFYPPVVRAWVRETDALGSLNFTKRTSLSARELIAMGAVRACSNK